MHAWGTILFTILQIAEGCWKQGECVAMYIFVYINVYEYTYTFLYIKLYIQYSLLLLIK